MNVGRVRAGGLIVPVIKDAGIFGLTGTAFAASFYRVGVKVAIVEMLDRVLSPLNKDITDFAEARLKKAAWSFASCRFRCHLCIQ